MRTVIWAGSSRRDLKEMPEEIRDAIGFGLYHAECGIAHSSIKILKGFGGVSVHEIKADNVRGTYRAVFTVKFGGYLYVLHAFQKKSKIGAKTPKSEMELIQSRLAWAVEDFKKRSGAHGQN